MHRGKEQEKSKDFFKAISRLCPDDESTVFHKVTALSAKLPKSIVIPL